MHPPVDLNCDLAEGEPAQQTRALLSHVTSANIACGVHAGDLSTLRNTLLWAAESDVRSGAHPGLAGNMGRDSSLIPSPSELAALLDAQLDFWLNIAESCRVQLHHIKLHGALYHAVNRNRELATAFADWMHHRFSLVRVYGPHVGYMQSVLLEKGFEVWSELFADRGYLNDGNLVPRNKPGAIIKDVNTVRDRLKQWLRTGAVQTVNGTWIQVKAQTVCIHGDTPGSVELARTCRECLLI